MSDVKGENASSTRGIADLSWVATGAGWLTGWHRPKLRDIELLRKLGCQEVVTVLSEKEGAPMIGKAVHAAGMKWTWIPLGSARLPMSKEEEEMVLEALGELNRSLDNGAHLFVHCSAGIHRTGMILYALLRCRGHDKKEALELIRRIREETRTGLDEARLNWGEAMADRFHSFQRGVNERRMI